MSGRSPSAVHGINITELVATTDLCALHQYNPDRYPFLLQSTARSSSLGRFDILFAFPGASLVLESPGQLTGRRSPHDHEFLRSLDRWWSDERAARIDTELPFCGGWFLYLGYELAAEIETALILEADPIMPAAIAVRCPAAIIVDHDEERCLFVAESTAPIEAAAVREDIAASSAARAPGIRRGIARPDVGEEEASLFLDAVAIAKRHIADGDIYQANLSRGWTAAVGDELDNVQIYRALCATNPGPFAGLVRWADCHVISSSPERLLQVRNGIASTRPIAGTRPRSADNDLDQLLSAELIAHPKERAEHVMLIDLERNDLGRICESGTVEVNEKMVLESYAHVHHIVSNVRGKLRQGVTPGDCIRAVFPGGTITGCPKVRCMQIIAELESGPRGAYTGSIGYLGLDGSIDLNILIRTMVMRGNRITLRAGSGIVADSEPEAELAETRVKAEGLIRALSP